MQTSILKRKTKVLPTAHANTHPTILKSSMKNVNSMRSYGTDWPSDWVPAFSSSMAAHSVTVPLLFKYISRASGSLFVSGCVFVCALNTIITWLMSTLQTYLRHVQAGGEEKHDECQIEHHQHTKQNGPLKQRIRLFPQQPEYAKHAAHIAQIFAGMLITERDIGYDEFLQSGTTTFIRLCRKVYTYDKHSCWCITYVGCLTRIFNIHPTQHLQSLLLTAHQHFKLRSRWQPERAPD